MVAAMNTIHAYRRHRGASPAGKAGMTPAFPPARLGVLKQPARGTQMNQMEIKQLAQDMLIERTLIIVTRIAAAADGVKHADTIDELEASTLRAAGKTKIDGAPAPQVDVDALQAAIREYFLMVRANAWP